MSKLTTFGFDESKKDEKESTAKITCPHCQKEIIMSVVGNIDKNKRVKDNEIVCYSKDEIVFYVKQNAWSDSDHWNITPRIRASKKLLGVCDVNLTMAEDELSQWKGKKVKLGFYTDGFGETTDIIITKLREREEKISSSLSTQKTV